MISGLGQWTRSQQIHTVDHGPDEQSIFHMKVKNYQFIRVEIWVTIGL